MAQIQAQKMTVDLPTLLVDSKGCCQGTTEPFLESMGYLAIPGTMDFAVDVDSRQDDPSQVRLTLRLLAAHYSPPAEASPAVLETVNRVNAEMARRLVGD